MALKVLTLAGCAAQAAAFGSVVDPPEYGTTFNRVATFPVCSQAGSSCEADTETVAEIVDLHVSASGATTAVYSDGALEVVGFVDLTDPSSPVPLGTVDVGGEVTSVAIAGDYVLAAVNTSPDYVNPSGVLHLIDVASRAKLKSWDLGGQPDAIGVSPDGRFAGIAIENERDEDLGDGAPPQMPPGSFKVLDMDSMYSSWVLQDVPMTGLTGCLYPTDPEPEYVAVNEDYVAVVTLQENNCIVLVDMMTATVTSSFTSGTLDLSLVDTVEDDKIDQSSSLTAVPREPDGVAWIGTDYFVTADEGDLNGGSRSFTIFDTSGSVVYTSGNVLEHIAARLGHYPEGRSENKGAEPENVAYGVFGGTPYIFVNLERASLVCVFDVSTIWAPEYKQSLPAALGPEGVKALPSKGILVVASEVDARDDKARSALNVYEWQDATTQYPTIQSANRPNGSPIPWGALSGLAADGEILYAVEDSFYVSNRIFVIDTAYSPARLTQEIHIKDTNDVFAAVSPRGTTGLTDDEFSAADLAAMINTDKTVNIDPEGIAKGLLGGETLFVVASEGSGTIGDASRPIKTLNFLFVTELDGTIKKVVGLPDSVNDIQLRFGFEGVTIYDNKIVVAFQRAWNGESGARIGVYDYAAETWVFYMYPLDTPTSPYGGWVGLSDITSVGGGVFHVLERDNQGGPDARIKVVYQIDINGLADGDTLIKTNAVDVKMPTLNQAHSYLFEKVEGYAVMADGTKYVVNDNDGIDDNSGESQLVVL